MKPEDVVLLVLDQSGGSLSGKTLLQKRAYFISIFANLDLGFKPHFYGPYSAAIESGLAECKALGLVSENNVCFGATDSQGFEVRRYDYSLTSDGQEVVGYLKKKFPQETSLIKSCLDKLIKAGKVASDYMSLSIAAKTYHILREQHRPMNKEAIKGEAEKLGWNISPESIEEAAQFLAGLQLIQTAQCSNLPA